MTLHAAKGLEFDTVFLPGWEEGLFPNQRALDESGRAGLEEERRLAHVGLTRARRRAKIYFASNRRIHGLWNVDPAEPLHRRVAGGACRGRSRRRRPSATAATARLALRPHGDLRRLELPDAGLAARPGPRQRAAASRRFRPRGRGGRARGPAHDRGRTRREIRPARSAFAVGARVFHIKFGPGTVAGVDGNKLTVDFDKAGRKMVLDSFLERAG